MAGIFANSSLAIAWPSSNNPQHGFLAHRSAGLHNVQLAEPFSHLHLRQKIQSFQVEIQNAPLHQRAWVFQETQLSRRILYFGIDKIMWRCREKWAREDTRSGFDLAFQVEASTLYHGQQAMERPSKNYGGSLLHQSNWYCLVNEYSGKQLTFQSDKLPALSAIAQEVQRLTGDSYVAGLWKISNVTAGPSFARSYLEDLKSPPFDEPEAASTLGMLPIAAVLTVSSPLQTFVRAAVLYPEWFSKVQEQVDAVCGLERMPEVEDAPRLPVLRAFLKECFRWRPPIPTDMLSILQT